MKNLKKLGLYIAAFFLFTFVLSGSVYGQTHTTEMEAQAIPKLKKASNDLWDQIAHLDPGEAGYEEGNLKMTCYQILLSNMGTYPFEDAKMRTILELSEGTADENDYMNGTLNQDMQMIKDHIDDVLGL